MHRCMIRPYKQNRFFCEQFSQFLLSWSDTTICYLRNIVHLCFFWKTSWHLKLHGPMWPKCGSCLLFIEKRTCPSEKPVAAFKSSRYLSIFSILVKACSNVNSCLCFLANHSSKAENAKKLNTRMICLDKQFRFFFKATG